MKRIMPVPSRVEKCGRRKWRRLLILMLFACAPSVLAHIAHAASNTDPFAYDPQFNNGVIVEDRFASTTTATAMIGSRVVISSDGSIVASGQVAAEYLGSPGGNFGAVRYGSSGNRTVWGAPTSVYSFYDNHYIDFPNNSDANYRVGDVKAVAGYIFALVDAGLAGSRSVYVLTFADGGLNTADGGKFLADTGAFTTSADEIGAALVPYTYPTYDGAGNQITAYRLIAVATYINSIGQNIITMKRFTLDIATGALAVDKSFGISNNGAMDLIAPNWMCNAGVYCSWDATAVTALRTDTDNPTLYLGGTAYARTSTLRDDGVVIAVNGYDGSLSDNFGILGVQSGIYVNQLANNSSVEALAATTPGAGAAASEDTVYVASSESYTSCGAYMVTVTKLLAQVIFTVHELPATRPDPNFADNGTLTFGGELADCVYSTFPADMLVDGNRLVIVGSEDLVPAVISASPPEVPLFAIVRTSDGALTDYQRGVLSPLHADGTPWGGGAFNSVALRSSGHYAVTGAIIDASANSASLFGTAVIASDLIFGNGFESP